MKDIERLNELGEIVRKVINHNRFLIKLDVVIEYSVLAVVFFLALSPTWTTVFLIVGSLAWLVKLVQERGRCFMRTPFDKIIACFVILSALSIFASPDMGFSFYNFYNLMGRYIFIYYLVVQNISTRKQLKYLLSTLLVSSLAVVAYGFYQYIYGIDVTSMLWVDGEQFPELKTRVFSTMQNPNILAGYLLVMMSLLFGVICKIRKKKAKILLGACFILMGLCLGMTYCRGAWISLVLVIAAYGLFHNRKILFALVLVCVLVLVFDASIAERLISVFNVSDTSSNMRFALWESTVAMISEHPLFGIGWGAYWMVYPEYDFFIQNDAVKIVHAHNMYLNFAAEIGIAGFLSFMAYMIGHLHLALSNTHLKKSNLLNGVTLGAGLSILCVAINGFTDYVLFNIELSMLFWLVNAVIVAVCKKELN
ncbi:MAG: hypothetical protein H6Q70_1705 [Firmicutes bacterium]|nr:hypothetical protein [Bacillota bacterium]